jgi:hypothetical protein
VGGRGGLDRDRRGAHALGVRLAGGPEVDGEVHGPDERHIERGHGGVDPVGVVGGLELAHLQDAPGPGEP